MVKFKRNLFLMNFDGTLHLNTLAHHEKFLWWASYVNKIYLVDVWVLSFRQLLNEPKRIWWSHLETLNSKLRFLWLVLHWSYIVRKWIMILAFTVDLPAMPDLTLPPEDFRMPRVWNTSSKFTRPRIFCLEHGVLIQELLQSKGGANMLVICHSGETWCSCFCTIVR